MASFSFSSFPIKAQANAKVVATCLLPNVIPPLYGQVVPTDAV